MKSVTVWRICSSRVVCDLSYCFEHHGIVQKLQEYSYPSKLVSTWRKQQKKYPKQQLLLWLLMVVHWALIVLWACRRRGRRRRPSLFHINSATPHITVDGGRRLDETVVVWWWCSGQWLVIFSQNNYIRRIQPSHHGECVCLCKQVHRADSRAGCYLFLSSAFN